MKVVQAIVFVAMAASVNAHAVASSNVNVDAPQVNCAAQAHEAQQKAEGVAEANRVYAQANVKAGNPPPAPKRPSSTRR